MKQPKRIFQGLFLLFLIVATTWILTHKRTENPYRTYEGRIFGTTFHIVYQCRTELDSAILKAMNDIDASLSTFNPNSTISRINAHQSKGTDPLFRQVFELAQKISRNTNGAFDITVAPLVNAWGFGFKNKENITISLIDSLMKHIGYQKICINNNVIETEDSLVMLDCSAIAKGYGCDKVAETLKQHGVENYMVEIGGEICTKGHNEEGHIWTIGIVTPKEENEKVNQSLQSVLQQADICLATSGNYRNFYYEGGKKFAHTIDPRTGYPVQHSILSSTVLASTCAEADAYATAFMVCGLEKAQAILASHPELNAHFIYTDEKGAYQTWSSENIKPYIK